MPKLTVNNITIKTLNRSNVDIETWRSALKSADRGKRSALYNLYEDLLLDNVLCDAIDKRITAITNAEITFTRDDKSVPEIDDLMDTPEFELVIEEILRAKFWGGSLLEFEFTDQGVIPHVVPRKHIRPEVGEIAIEEGDERGVPYRDSDFFLEVDTKGLGLILKAAPYVIYKRNNVGDWAQYAEIFGRPSRTVFYEAYDEAMRIETARALASAGGGMDMVMPKGCEVDIKPAAAGGDGSVFDRLRGACNEEILIGILGQVMTTLDGSSRSQGEVHLEVQEGKHKADRRFVQRILNRRLLPLLEKRGYPVSGGYFYFPDAGENISLVDRITMDTQIASMMPVGRKHFYDTYGIAMPEDGEPLAGRPAGGAGSPGPDDPGPDEDDDPATNDVSVWARMLDFFAAALGRGALLSGDRHTLISSAPDDDPADSADMRLIKRVARGEVRYFDAELFARTSADLLGAMHEGLAGRKGLHNLGIDYKWQNPAVITAMETNVFHFSAAKTLVEIQSLNEAFRGSASFDEFSAEAKAITGKFNDKWAKTEYITANAMASASANYHSMMADTDIFPYWQYCTAGDTKVRREHALLDGLVLPVRPMYKGDTRYKAWDKIYPPNDWRCRCHVVQRMAAEASEVDFGEMDTRLQEYYKSGDYKSSEANGFAVNRFDSRVLFTENQMYIRKFPAKATKLLDKIGASDYNLESIGKATARATMPIPEVTVSAPEWFAARAVDDVVTIQSYNDRPISMTKRIFDTHTTDVYKKRSHRVELLDSISPTLASPDEVWINDYITKNSFDNYVFVRYFKNKAIAVVCRAENDTLQLKSWFEVYDAKKIRRGLLIKKGQE